MPVPNVLIESIIKESVLTVISHFEWNKPLLCILRRMLYNLFDILSDLPLTVLCQKPIILDLTIKSIGYLPSSPYRITFGVDFLALRIMNFVKLEI